MSGSLTSTGATARPEGEEAAADAGISGEATSVALANNGSRPSSPSTGVDGPLMDITRATTRIQMDVALVAQEPKAHIKRDPKTGCRTCAPDCKACALLKELQEVQREARSAANAAMRLLLFVDARIVEKCQLEHGRAPKGREWSDIALQHVESLVPQHLRSIGRSLVKSGKSGSRYVYLYPLLRALAPNAAAGISRESTSLSQRPAHPAADSCVKAGRESANVHSPSHLVNVILGIV